MPFENQAGIRTLLEVGGGHGEYLTGELPCSRALGCMGHTHSEAAQQASSDWSSGGLA